MGDCSYCGSMIVFGGVRNGEYRFCNAQCHERGIVVRLATQLPDDVVLREVELIHKGNCPQCSRPGPVDLHVSHRVWSALIRTSWQSRPHICCASCGRWKKISDATFSLLLGWWGIPWGIVMTPIQVIKNGAGLLKSMDATRPSDALTSVVRARLAREFVRRQQEQSLSGESG